jgi:hypothetical protein
MGTDLKKELLAAENLKAHFALQKAQVFGQFSNSELN